MQTCTRKELGVNPKLCRNRVLASYSSERVFDPESRPKGKVSRRVGKLITLLRHLADPEPGTIRYLARCSLVSGRKIMKQELALPVANWVDKEKQEIILDFASALLEFQRKPNFYILKLNKKGELDLKKGVRKDNEVFKREFKALKKTEKWIKNGPAKYQVWISGKKDGFYKASRLIISKRYSEGNFAFSNNWAFCTNSSPRECIDLANRLLNFSPQNIKINDEETLRENPIQFTPPGEEDWISFLLKITQDNFAKQIEDGTVFKQKEKAVEDATPIVDKHLDDIKNAKNLLSQVVVGAEMEEDAEIAGYDTNSFRDCPGLTNTEVLAGLGAFDSLYLTIINKDPDRYKYDKIDKCKNCKVLKMVASPPQGCGICRDCQIKFDKKSLFLHSFKDWFNLI